MRVDNRYQLLEQIGQGGMALVYKAFDEKLNRIVAIKVIRKDAFGDSELKKIIKRFNQEAKALGKLHHPNILNIHDYGIYDNLPYMVMEYVPGLSLKKINELLDLKRTIEIVSSMAGALSYAHKNGIIHRDVKPSNILIQSDGSPLLSDFGIAKVLSDEDLTLTGTSVGMGTPEYMAPEQGTSARIDERTDIYSLGVVFYELLVGEKPYNGTTPLAILLQQINDPIPDPRSMNPEIPDEIVNIITRALAKDPEQRYQSMDQMNADIFAFCNKNELFLPSMNHHISVTQKQEEPDNCIDNNSKSLPKRNKIFTRILVIFLFFMFMVVFFITANKAQDNIKDEVKDKEVTISDTNVEMMPIKVAETESVQENLRNQITSEEREINPTEISSTQVQNRSIDGMAQVRIAGGEYKVGWDYGNTDEAPIHTVILTPYWIDKYEVTNQMYQTCVDSGACSLPKTMASAIRSDYYSNDEFINYPVINIDWNQANDYCNWVGGRLPTEAEWEVAANCGINQKYPWGNTSPNENLSNFQNVIGDTTSVGSYDTNNKCELLDMAGNVAEWVNDWYSPEYYSVNEAWTNPMGLEYGAKKVLRGGAWNSDSWEVRSTFRDSASPDSSGIVIGFRCVIDSN